MRKKKGNGTSNGKGAIGAAKKGPERKDMPHAHKCITLNSSILRSIQDIKPGDHLCCIYRTEEEHRAILTPYLRAGLEMGEKVFYIVDAHSAQNILDYLKADGVDTGPYLSRGQLSILTVSDSYMKQGVFDPKSMIELLRSETAKAVSEGYGALRVTGEMTWALKGLKGSERLIEYESLLNEFFPGSSAMAICQYDQRRFGPEILLSIVNTHPFVILGTEVFDNIYFIPPNEFHEGETPQLTLDYRLKTLKERKTAEAGRKESEARYRELFDNMNTGVAVYEVKDDGKDFIF